MKKSIEWISRSLLTSVFNHWNQKSLMDVTAVQIKYLPMNLISGKCCRQSLYHVLMHFCLKHNLSIKHALLPLHICIEKIKSKIVINNMYLFTIKYTHSSLCHLIITQHRILNCCCLFNIKKYVSYYVVGVYRIIPNTFKICKFCKQVIFVRTYLSRNQSKKCSV